MSEREPEQWSLATEVTALPVWPSTGFGAEVLLLSGFRPCAVIGGSEDIYQWRPPGIDSVRWVGLVQEPGGGGKQAHSSRLRGGALTELVRFRWPMDAACSSRCLHNIAGAGRMSR